MLTINQEIHAVDVAEALVGEVGIFQVTDLASGQRYTLRAKPGHSLTNFRSVAEGPTPVKGFLIRKTGEPYGAPNWPGV